ncbi:MAG: tetratricopeptide repeat protein [Kiritimatiellia bacterium]
MMENNKNTWKSKSVVTVLIAVFFCMGARAEFLDDFQRAYNLFQDRQWEASSAAFQKLAPAAGSAELRDKCVSYAARACARQGEFDEAMELAGKIEDPAVKAFAQMAAMSAGGKNPELLEKFKVEKIDAWPDEIAYRGYLMRGKALMPGAEAIADLEKAAANCGVDNIAGLDALRCLAMVYDGTGARSKKIAVLDRAVEIGEKNSGLRGNEIFLTPALARAQEAIVDRDFATAFKVLGIMGRPRGSWTCRIEEVRGDLYAAQGDKSKAEKCYCRALAEENVRDEIRKPVREKLARLETE